jgi:hypothetical protein
VRSKINLRKLSVFWALCAGLSVACSSNARPPVPASSTPAPQANQAAQPNAQSAGHDHATHELEEKMPRIIPEELRRLMANGQAVVIDVRSPEDFRQKRIPGAINLPMPQIEAGNYPKLPRDKRLISYCA